jgi:TM2 domain-containing membrane protein YozV
MGTQMCPMCRQQPMAGWQYCWHCGQRLDFGVVSCPTCTAEQPAWAPPTMAAPVYGGAAPYPAVYGVGPPKSKVAAALLAFFLGAFGAHRFYLGHAGLGVTMLLVAIVGGFLTLGVATIVVGVWAFIDFILILTGGIRDSQGRELV